MGDQRTFASMAWNGKGKITRRERFLAEMDAVIPWPRLGQADRTALPQSRSGSAAFGTGEDATDLLPAALTSTEGARLRMTDITQKPISLGAYASAAARGWQRPAGGLMLTNVCGQWVSVHLKSFPARS